MCLSDVYEVNGSEETLVCKRVLKVSTEGDALLLTDFMGTEIRVPGKVKDIDLNKNIILIDAT